MLLNLTWRHGNHMLEQPNHKKEEKILKQYTDLMFKLTNKYFRYYNNQYSFDDLFQEAQLATLKAIRTYDESKNVKLITHIYNQINFRFSHYSRSNTGIIKIPAKVVSQKLNAPKMVDSEFLYDNAESSELISYVISDDNLIIQEYMNILNERQKDIIHKIFILGYTYDDLAKEYKVSRQAISQVVNTSFKKIRQKFTV